LTLTDVAVAAFFEGLSLSLYVAFRFFSDILSGNYKRSRLNRVPHAIYEECWLVVAELRLLIEFRQLHKSPKNLSAAISPHFGEAEEGTKAASASMVCTRADGAFEFPAGIRMKGADSSCSMKMPESLLQ
jgi:hypothetical protein